MTTGETEPFATRLSAEEAASVREATDQTGLSRSDLLALGFRYYMAENPDNIPAFRLDDPDRGPLEKIGVLAPPTESRWTRTEDR